MVRFEPSVELDCAIARELIFWLEFILVACGWDYERQSRGTMHVLGVHDHLEPCWGQVQGIARRQPAQSRAASPEMGGNRVLGG